ncbi:MAG TPA: type II CAAX endopeptidase family protein [Symbiobacteriaceae bacterium]
MHSRPIPLPVRATLFYTVALLLLITVGGYLQHRFHLAGIILVQVGLFLGLSAVFGLLLDQRPAREVFRLRRLTAQGLLKSVLLGVLAWALAQVLGLLMLALLDMLGGRMPPQYQELLEAPYPLALLAGALVPAICEEAAFRGYIQTSLRPLGPTGAVVLTGLLFGMMHLSLIRLLPLTVLGLLFAAAAERSGSLLPSMCMHFVNNGIALTLAFLLQGRSDSLLAGEGVRATTWPDLLILTLVAAVLSAAAWAVVRSLGPGDVAAGTRPAEPEPSAPAPRRELIRARYLLTLMPLLPAFLIYLWATGSELAAAFTPAP